MLNLKSTVEGTLLENFYPAGWDFDKIEKCIDSPEKITDMQKHWNKSFAPVFCEDVESFDVKMGFEIAQQIIETANNCKLVLILPAGPMGMYKWTAYFLNRLNIDCSHVYTFNMDEYADATGNSVAGDNEASFEYAMTTHFFDKIEKSVPVSQRHFASKESLPQYDEKILRLKSEGAKHVLVYGIGRMCHIAFWEPQYAAEYADNTKWLAESCRLGAKLHPLTVEQNAITSFKSRTTLVPATANTVGPKILFTADYAIGGCDGVLSRGMQWQGLSLWMTLRYGVSRWVPSTYVTQIPGKLFFVKELAGPLTPATN